MDDLKELLETLRGLGVKSATFREEGALSSVEFFSSLPALDLGALDEPGEAVEEAISPALARILKRSSVS